MDLFIVSYFKVQLWGFCLGDVVVVLSEGFEVGVDGVQGLFGGLFVVVEGYQCVGGVVQYVLQLLQVVGVVGFVNWDVDQEFVVSGGQVVGDQWQVVGFF